MAADVEYMKKQLLTMDYHDITKSFIESNFARHFDTTTKKMVEPLYSFQDKITLNKGDLQNISSKMETTLGRLLVNKFLFSDNLMHVIPYINEPITKKRMSKYEQMIANALIDGKIDSTTLTNYYTRVQWLGFAMHVVVCASLSEKTIYPLPEVQKLKEELFKKYADDLKGPNALLYGSKIEEILMDEARKALKDDPGLDFYNAGLSKATFKGTYKDMMIVKGPVWNNVTKRFDIIKSCLASGINKDEIDSFGSQVISGAYPKAVETRDSGYTTKKLFACYQHVMLDEPGSDCKSKKCRTMKLTADNYGKVKYRYIVDNGKLVCLTPEIAPKYFGKTVEMRSPMYCAGERLCSKCAGELPYKLKIENIGLTISDIGSRMLYAGMKGFHDSSVDLYEVDINDLLL